MPSLHKFLKVKAGAIRVTAVQGRLFARIVVKNAENQKLAAAAAAVTRPSFVNSFVSSFSSSAASSGAAAATLDFKHGSDTGLTASEALSRAVATPSVHGPLRQSSLPLMDGAGDHSQCSKGVPPERGIMVVNPRGRMQEILCRATRKGGNADIDRVTVKSLGRDSTIAISCLGHEVLKERRWRALGADVKVVALRRVSSAAELDKVSVENRAERVVHRENGASSSSSGFEDAGRDMRRGLPKGEKGDTIGKAGGRKRGKSAGKAGVSGAVGLQPLRNRVATAHVFCESRIVPRMGSFFTRAVHDMSLAGEGGSIDHPSYSERQSDQSASVGKSLKLLSGACNLPHPDKVKTGGEDAYFICPDKQVFGVADGVGGWADLGIDAGEYARELMSQAKAAVHQEPAGCIDPARVMEKAHSLTKCRGSSTACILALTDSDLKAWNLGDSGFVIVRNSRPIFKSPVQQHQFNIPFQLENGGSDPPSAAQVSSHPVTVGDVIVAGTDGVFDNLYDNELTTLVVQATRVHMTPQVTAEKIAALARSRAEDKNRQTPFSTSAQDAGFRFYGGKMDDITVIVAYITSSKSTTSKL